MVIAQSPEKVTLLQSGRVRYKSDPNAIPVRTKIDSTLGILIRSNGCGSPIFHGIHAFEEDPGREEAPRAGERTLLLGAVSLAKLLHLMTALGGGFGGAGVGAAAGDGGDDEFGVTEF
ncbi:hypothetical protein F0562_019536 [Nyssa sinensis]|uniref:Uncharacterized protein n=1 Tax=Nyssa sinensis TaxID=561372 RepID=A0A5J5BRR4_9ASTE|nr:hypothetical protein F0562_019536 [Nyssa sinensis]